MATFNRAHLLHRSLTCYENQRFDNDLMELIIVDDHSTDHTQQLVNDWSRSTGIRCVLITPSPKKTIWRDCGAVYNYGIRASSGDHILLTHPEVMVGKNSVHMCVNALQVNEHYLHTNNLYACCRIYYLSPRDQENLDTVNWALEGTLAVRKLPGFYDEDENHNPDFTHRATDSVAQPNSRIRTWESLVFGGCSRKLWKELGGMLETQKWGSVDVAFMQRRRTLGIFNHTCPEEDTICIHQNHDLPHDIPSPRVEEVWKKELQGVNLLNPDLLKYPAVDYLGWG